MHDQALVGEIEGGRAHHQSPRVIAMALLVQVAGRHRRARQALEYDHPYGMPEQGEHAQGGAKVCGVGVGFSSDSISHDTPGPERLRMKREPDGVQCSVGSPG